MKKNLMTVITFALVLVNLVFTVVLTITVVPEAQKANELITKVCAAIDLDLESGDNGGTTSIPIEDIEVYDIADQLTINLRKTEGDKKDHYAILTIALSINTKSDDYKAYSESLSTKEGLIKTQINNVVSGYTMEEIQSDPAAVQKAILKELQKMFSTDFIVGVGFSSATYQ